MIVTLEKVDKEPILDEVERYGKLLREYKDEDGLNKIWDYNNTLYYTIYLENKCISFGVVEEAED